MNESIKTALTSKWRRILDEYIKVKHGKSTLFSSVQEVCEAYGVSRKDINKYYGRWLNAGKDPEALLPRRRGPKPGTTKLLSKAEERIVIKIRRKLQANEHEIFSLIHGHFRLHPSVSTIYRTLKRYPLNTKRKQKILRYEKHFPGELLHADTCQMSKILFVDQRKRYLFGMIDDCTRLCYVQLIDDCRSKTVTKAFCQGLKWFSVHGISVEALMTDNGTEFTTPMNKDHRGSHLFEIILEIFGIRHLYTRPHRPQTNGKIERFWKIIKEECVRLQSGMLTEEEFKHEIEGFLYRYNYQRKHAGLNYQTPLDKLLFVTETLK